MNSWWSTGQLQPGGGEEVGGREPNLITRVIVDCTSSEAVAVQYADFLGAGFHVVTPEQEGQHRVAAGLHYKALRRTCPPDRRKFLYERPTRARGLPVIENPQNLIKGR